MTNPIQYGGPTPQPYPGYIPPAAPRPGAVTTVAIIAIVMGALGVICCGITGLVGATVMGDAALPDGTVIRQDPTVTAITLTLASISLITSALLLAVGIGALSLKPSARKLGVPLAVALLAIAISRFIATVVFTGPRTEETMKKIDEANARQQKSGQPAPPSLAKFASGMTMGFGVFLLLLECTTPALILLLWNTPRVKQAFANGLGGGIYSSYATGPGTPAPGGYPPADHPAGNYPPGGPLPPPQ